MTTVDVITMFTGDAALCVQQSLDALKSAPLSQLIRQRRALSDHEHNTLVETARILEDEQRHLAKTLWKGVELGVPVREQDAARRTNKKAVKMLARLEKRLLH